MIQVQEARSKAGLTKDTHLVNYFKSKGNNHSGLIRKEYICKHLTAKDYLIKINNIGTYWLNKEDYDVLSKELKSNNLINLDYLEYQEGNIDFKDTYKMIYWYHELPKKIPEPLLIDISLIPINLSTEDLVSDLKVLESLTKKYNKDLMLKFTEYLYREIERKDDNKNNTERSI